MKNIQPLIKESIKQATQNERKFKPINKHFLPNRPQIPLKLMELIH